MFWFSRRKKARKEQFLEELVWKLNGTGFKLEKIVQTEYNDYEVFSLPGYKFNSTNSHTVIVEILSQLDTSTINPLKCTCKSCVEITSQQEHLELAESNS